MFLGEKLHISAVGHGKSVVKMIAKTDEGRVVMEAKATRTAKGTKLHVQG